jgi:predicted transcriptional regulator of viral defense system
MRSQDYFDTHPVFTFDEYRSARGRDSTSLSTVKNLLAGHVAAGRVVRVRQGLYATVPRGVDAARFEPDPFLLASHATDGAIVCGHAALQFFGKTYSVWSRFHFFAPQPRRPFSYRGAEFVPLLAPPSLRADAGRAEGVLQSAHAGGTVRVTSLERTLVDVLHAPDRAGGWEESWRSLEQVEYYDTGAVERHVRELGSALTAARVGYFLESHADALMLQPGSLDGIRRMAPRQARYLDASHQQGRLDRRWNLIVPTWLAERSWGEVS